MLDCSGCQPARRGVYSRRRSVQHLRSRRAWPALEETAQPGVRRDNPHTHTLSKFTTVCHSELEP